MELEVLRIEDGVTCYGFCPPADTEPNLIEMAWDGKNVHACLSRFFYGSSQPSF